MNAMTIGWMAIAISPSLGRTISTPQLMAIVLDRTVLCWMSPVTRLLQARIAKCESQVLADSSRFC